VVHVFVDTVPPDLQVEVKILAYDKAVVSGKVKDAAKVVVDGKPVDVDLFGGFSRDVAVDPDKSMLEVIATDALGNQKKIKRSAKIASPLSGDSK
jgi:L-aminopeptidase/D-esterase-like protein